jgi:hypothetical protein
LRPHAVTFRPVFIVLLLNLALFYNPLRFIKHRGRDKHLFLDQRVVLVLGVVRVPQLAIGPELELQKLVAELAFVALVGVGWK